MATENSSIPGLFEISSQGMPNSQNPGQNTQTDGLLSDLYGEKASLSPNLVHAKRLIEQEIGRVQKGERDPVKVYYVMDGNKTLTEKVFIPMELQRKHNLVGRLLGPRGVVLKAIQRETKTRMVIQGKGSMKNPKREQELINNNEPGYAHLKENLHVLIEAQAPYSNMKLSAAVADVSKMLIPPLPGHPDTMLARYLPIEDGGDQFPPPNPSPRGGRGGAPRGPGGPMRGRGGPARGGRGGFSDRGGYGNGTRASRGGYSDRGSYGGGERHGGYSDRPSSWREGEDFERSYTKQSSFSRPEEYDDSYTNFSDSRYGRDGGIPSNDYHHGEWKAPRGRREPTRNHPYSRPGY